MNMAKETRAIERIRRFFQKDKDTKLYPDFFSKKKKFE